MARHMSVVEYQELGRRYYKLKEYEKAVEAFTQAINVAPSVNLYDHRAASYDRLKDYNAAVKDGREAIKCNKNDVRGYLRTASVLEKLEKYDVALGIYKYGMKNVPSHDQNFKVLQQLHDKMTRKLSPAKSVDPLTVLPVELAEMILEYLTFKAIVNSMRVSRGWRDYIAKMPRLWMHLNLSAARKPVPRTFVDKAVRRSGNRLTQMTIHRFEHVDMLVNIAKSCKSLAELDFVTLPHAMSSTLIEILRHAPSLKKLIVRPEVTWDTASQLLERCPSLEYVALQSMQRCRSIVQWRAPLPHLRTLSIQLDKGISTPLGYIENLLSQTPSLQSLTLNNMAMPLDTFADLPLTSLILKRVGFLDIHFPRLPSTLQTLVLEVSGGSSGLVSHQSLLDCHIPQLKHLTLSNVNILHSDYFVDLLNHFFKTSDTDTPSILDNAQPLETLSLRGPLLEPTFGLFKNEKSLCGCSPRILTPALKTLDLATLQCDDDEIEWLLKYETGITSIDISSTQVSGASLKMLADSLPSLRSIRADNCPRINGRDAIEYVQRKGIAISCSMSEAKGSKKVRY